MSAIQQVLATIGASGATAYRYWRLNVTAPALADQTYAALDEVELRATVGGADLTTTSTPVAVSANAGSLSSGLIPTNLVDNSIGTPWVSQGLADAVLYPYTLTFDLGSAQTVQQIAILSQNGAPGRAPGTFSVQGSNDNVGFTTVNTFSPGNTWTSVPTLRTFNL